MTQIGKSYKKYLRLSLLAVLGLMMTLSLVPAANAQVGGQPYVGEILAAGFSFAPHGWALCQGQIMSIQQNTALFSLLGTTYGGDGKTTFALPDLRGRTPIGSGQSTAGSNFDLGQTGGEEVVTLTLGQMPAHSHVPQGTTNAATTAAPSGQTWATARAFVYSSSANTPMAPLVLSPAGGGQPHDNLSPYLTLNYIIALQGVFPSRP